MLFTLCFIAGVQLPEFIQQYSQRLSGHLNEAQHHLTQFQVIADVQFNGDLSELINRYQQNSDPAIIQTGQLVNNLTVRIDELAVAFSQLQQESYWQRIVYFVQEMNIEMAQATAQQFVLAIPLTFNALVTGALFAFSILTIKELLIMAIKALSTRIFSTKTSTTA